MGDYMSDLRKLVGHQTLLHCCASIIVENEKGEILLGKRTDNHYWGYFGGAIEIDERVEDCACRELFEETGLIAHELELFMINSGPEVHYTYPNGDDVFNVEINYLCKKYHGDLKAQKEEITELKYFDKKDVTLEMISPPTRPVVKKYLETNSSFLAR